MTGTKKNKMKAELLWQISTIVCIVAIGVLGLFSYLNYSNLNEVQVELNQSQVEMANYQTELTEYQNLYSSCKETATMTEDELQTEYFMLQEDYEDCQSGLSAAQTHTITTTTEKSQCESDYNVLQIEYTECKSDLTTVEGNYDTCSSDLRIYKPYKSKYETCEFDLENKEEQYSDLLTNYNMLQSSYNTLDDTYDLLYEYYISLAANYAKDVCCDYNILGYDHNYYSLGTTTITCYDTYSSGRKNSNCP